MVHQSDNVTAWLRVGGTAPPTQGRPRVFGRVWLPVMWTRHLTDLRFCCAANVVTASVARELAAYRDCSNRLLDRVPHERSLRIHKCGLTRVA